MAETIIPVKETDFLDQDPPIRGQNYFAVSFISPEDVITRKETFFFNKFLKTFGSDLGELFQQISERFKDDKSILESIRSVRDRYDYVFDVAALGHEYEYFKKNNSETLEPEYLKINNFQTTIRGFKMRGCYETLAEAKKRVEQIKKFDNSFHVYVGQVGCWCPWSPYPDDVCDEEYAESQLNTLMKKYKEGQDVKNELYKIRKDDLMKQVTMFPEQNNVDAEIEQKSVENTKL